MKTTIKKLAIVLSLFIPFVLLTGCTNDTIMDWASNAEQRSLVNSTIHNTDTLVDSTIYSAATLDDDFEDDTILVVLTRIASRNFTSLTPMDFPELELSEVICLTPGLEQAQAQIAASLSDRASSFYYDSNWSLDINQFRQILMLRLANPCRENVLDAIRILEMREDIHSAEPDYNFQIDYVIETPFSLEMLESFTTSTSLWNLNAISVGEAHALTSGVNTVRVGLLSTGVDASRPDLGGGRIYPVTSRGVNQPTGSQNFHPNDTSSPLTDPAGHGSHIAGTIIGTTVGVAPNIRLVSLKVATGPNMAGSYNSSAIIAAIQYAGQIDPIRGGLRIPILSLSHQAHRNNVTVRNAIRGYAGLFVGSAGNANGNADNLYPLIRTDRIDRKIVVGATMMFGSNELRWWNSNFGAQTVCVFAPGHDIWSTVPLVVNSSGFRFASGTSMATPHVAATAALMLSVNPNLTPAQIRTAIINTVDIHPNLPVNLSVSGGRLNAYRAVSSALATNFPTIRNIQMNIPLANTASVSTITATTQYTGTVTWADINGTPLGTGQRFVPRIQYVATITLTPRAGFGFSGIPEDFFTVAGALSVTTNNNIVTVVFPVTNNITSSAMSVIAPVAGFAPTHSVNSAQYTGTVTWASINGTPLGIGQRFSPGTQYVATITLTARSGFDFTGIPVNFFTVAGASQVTNAAESNIVTAVFPATARTVTNSTVQGVPVPAAFAEIKTVIGHGGLFPSGRYSGNIFWHTDNIFFNELTEYTATIFLVPPAGHTFYGVPSNFFTVPGATSVTNAANSGVLTAKFPMTGEHGESPMYSFDITLNIEAFSAAIGTFDLHSDHFWTFSGNEDTFMHPVSFDPDSDELWNYLEFDFSSFWVFHYLSMMNLSTIVQLSVTIPIANPDVHVINWVMDIKISGNGAELLSSSYVVVDNHAWTELPVTILRTGGSFYAETNVLSSFIMLDHPDFYGPIARFTVTRGLWTQIHLPWTIENFGAVSQPLALDIWECCCASLFDYLKIPARMLNFLRQSNAGGYMFLTIYVPTYPSAFPTKWRLDIWIDGDGIQLIRSEPFRSSSDDDDVQLIRSELSGLRSVNLMEMPIIVNPASGIFGGRF
ncbi:MAG: S8 family serine peptidase [Treponema sp.]|nr:S8 family serine peptidase [Treponema sp.]